MRLKGSKDALKKTFEFKEAEFTEASKQHLFLKSKNCNCKKMDAISNQNKMLKDFIC